jgi:hypothetical protein
MNEPMLGQFTLSTVIAVVMGATFGAFPYVPDRMKNLVAMLLGACLSVMTMIAKGQAVELQLIIPYITDGFMYGIQAVGTYNVLKKPEPENKIVIPGS